MCCDDCEQCVLITVLVQTIIVAIGSLIMTIYGGVLWAQNVDGSDQVFAFLVSLPLTPSVERPRDIYFVSNQTNQSISIQNNFSIMMPTITDSRLFSFYLVHNMFGYHLNITLHGAAEYEYELDFNADSDNLSTVEYKTITECEVSTRNIQTYEDYTKIWVSIFIIYK